MEKILELEVKRDQPPVTITMRLDADTAREFRKFLEHTRIVSKNLSVNNLTENLLDQLMGSGL